MRAVPDRNTLSFVALCIIWGTTWIGIKAGIDTVPPLFFAGSRFFAAGLLLLLLAWLRRERITPERKDMPRFVVVSLLMISLCYGPLFWGMQFINSGMAGVLEMSLTPIALLFFALLLREEAWDARRFLAIGLGVAGLAILFGPDALAESSSNASNIPALRLWGALAVASAAFTYGLGSVLARPLLRAYPPFFVAGVTTLGGGTSLLAYALTFEEGTYDALSGAWGIAAWSGWLFLVVFGSLIGYTIYMRLLRDIGASRAGSYAFVSPVVAVLLGVVVYQETVSVMDIAGMFIMLVGAYLAMSKLRSRSTAPPARASALSGRS